MTLCNVNEVACCNKLTELSLRSTLLYFMSRCLSACCFGFTWYVHGFPVLVHSHHSHRLFPVAAGDCFHKQSLDKATVSCLTCISLVTTVSGNQNSSKESEHWICICQVDGKRALNGLFLQQWFGNVFYSVLDVKHVHIVLVIVRAKQRRGGTHVDLRHHMCSYSRSLHHCCF